MNRNISIVVIASVGLALLYVIAPLYWEVRAGFQYELLIELLWTFYVYVLPAIIGAVVAILISGPFGERCTRTILALALPVIVAFLWSGRAGLELDSFRISMIFLAVTGGIYAIAGCMAAFIATRRRDATSQPGSRST